MDASLSWTVRGPTRCYLQPEGRSCQAFTLLKQPRVAPPPPIVNHSMQRRTLPWKGMQRPTDVAWKGRPQEEEGLPEDKRRHHEPALIRLALPPSSPPACPCVFIMAPPSTSAPFMASSRRLFCGRIHIVCATDAVFVSLERSTLPEHSTRKAGPQDRSPQAWGGLPRHFLRCLLPKGHLETPPEATYPHTCGHDIALGNPGSSDPYSQPY